MFVIGTELELYNTLYLTLSGSDKFGSKYVFFWTQIDPKLTPIQPFRLQLFIHLPKYFSIFFNALNQ